MYSETSNSGSCQNLLSILFGFRHLIQWPFVTFHSILPPALLLLTFSIFGFRTKVRNGQKFDISVRFEFQSGTGNQHIPQLFYHLFCWHSAYSTIMSRSHQSAICWRIFDLFVPIAFNYTPVLMRTIFLCLASESFYHKSILTNFLIEPLIWTLMQFIATFGLWSFDW